MSAPAPDSARSVAPLSEREVDLLDAWWRAANYLSVGQIYLLANPLLREPLRAEHVKPRLLGHWGTTPGLNFIYAHVNRAIKAHGLDVIFVTGPGHGGPALVASAYLDGTYSEVYPRIGRDEEGLRRLFRQFSFPGGVPSHVAPETPGSIHEGGELGYALVHAYGAVFDNPELLAVCVVGDGEAETGPLAASWHSNKFLDPQRDGCVLPVLHLNGYKIANPAVLARIPRAELRFLLEGYGYAPRFVEGSDPARMHQLMAAALEEVVKELAAIRRVARAEPQPKRPRWPMLVLVTPKGWTGPKEVDGLRTEGTFRSHQVPLGEVRTNPRHLAQLEEWLRSYRPEELFTADGAPRDELTALAPVGDRRMSANPHANGGLLLRDLDMPDFRDYAVPVSAPASTSSEATRVLGQFLRDVMRANGDRFRVMGPDETVSNRLGAILEATDRTWVAERLDSDDHLAPDGRVMEVLSEHLCQGWLEGYLLTGRHGLFNCYEAFIHIVDSMVNQHAKWLKVTRGIPWRRPIASLNYVLSSHVWRQDNNGFSHQDPGFIDHVVNKKAEIIRVYLPPDANCLLSVADHCLRSRHYVNVIVAGKQPALDYLSVDEALARGADGNLWFTEASADKIGRISPSGTFAEFPIPTSGSRAEGIAAGPDGNLWFTEFKTNNIARITPAGVVTEFPVPTPKSGTEWITSGTDGNAWFTEAEGNKIGRITPSGSITEFELPTANSAPAGIVPGADGNLWFTEYEAGRIGRLGAGVAEALLSAPAVAGGGQQGSAQTCTVAWSTWDSLQPQPSLLGFDGYRWLLDGAPIASGQTYTPTVADIGHKLACSVTGTYPLPLLVSSVATSAPIVVTAPPTPVITAVRESAASWRAGGALARISRRHARRRPPVGTTISFALNVQATVTFTFTQPREGRKAGRACVPRTRHNARRRRCTRTVTVGQLSFPAHAGTNTVAFQGRISAASRLARGRYALVIVATNTAGVASAPVALHFTIVR